MEILLVIQHSNLLAQYACKLLYVYVIVQVSEMEVSEYMQEVVETMKTARRRGQRFLHPTSITKVISYKLTEFVLHPNCMYALSALLTTCNSRLKPRQHTFLLKSNITHSTQSLIFPLFLPFPVHLSHLILTPSLCSKKECKVSILKLWLEV